VTRNTQQLSPPQDPTQPTAPLPSVHRLKSITVVGGFLDGVRLDLADGLNCIIGARGTGKTTALELVRYAIDALPSRETNPAEHRRIESLIQQNLSGGRVEVKTAISLAGSGIFKADVFSQNEVEGIADRAASQLALIGQIDRQASTLLGSDITNGPNGPMLQDIVRELSECGQEVDRLLERAQLERLRNDLLAKSGFMARQPSSCVLPRATAMNCWPGFPSCGTSGSQSVKLWSDGSTGPFCRPFA